MASKQRASARTAKAANERRAALADQDSGEDVHRKSALRENFESIAVAALFAIFVRGFIAQPYKIPSGSMEDTLLIGDHLVVNKILFGTTAGTDGPSFLPTRAVHRGDIVILRPPQVDESVVGVAVDENTDYIKRVMGLPGEEIRIDFDRARHGARVFIDGEPVPENYRVGRVVEGPDGVELSFDPIVHEDGARWTVQYAENPPEIRERGWLSRTFQLGDDEYFVMGDNRNNSADSRYWARQTFLKGERIRGRAWFVYWSYEATEGEPVGFASRIAHYADIAWHFFSRSRWSRTLRPLH